MAIVGEHIKAFALIDIEESKNDISQFLSMNIRDAQSKHIARLDENTKTLHALSKKVFYEYDVFGSHRKHTTLEDERQRIANMMECDCQRAARFVICRDGRIWADNTHWTIAYILRYGPHTVMNDIPSYLIDFRMEIPYVINKGNVVFDSTASIKSAIACAKRIQDRVDIGWRPMSLSYTIQDLMNDLEIARN